VFVGFAGSVLVLACALGASEYESTLLVLNAGHLMDAYVEVPT
jgi:hypothetical protein